MQFGMDGTGASGRASRTGRTSMTGRIYKQAGQGRQEAGAATRADRQGSCPCPSTVKFSFQAVQK